MRGESRVRVGEDSGVGSRAKFRVVGLGLLVLGLNKV